MSLESITPTISSPGELLRALTHWLPVKLTDSHCLRPRCHSDVHSFSMILENSSKAGPLASFLYRLNAAASASLWTDLGYSSETLYQSQKIRSEKRSVTQPNLIFCQVFLGYDPTFMYFSIPWSAAFLQIILDIWYTGSCEAEIQTMAILRLSAISSGPESGPVGSGISGYFPGSQI